MGRRAERKAARDLADRGEIELVGAQLAALGCAAVGPAPCDEQIAAWPALTLTGLELQVVGLEFEAAGAPLAAQPARSRLQRQRQQLGPEPGLHIVQHEVRRRPYQLALDDINPRAQRAAAVGDFDAQVGVAAQLRQIDTREIGIHLTIPFLPARAVAREQRLPELASDGESLTPLAWRRRIEPDGMAAARVVKDQIDLLQCERRRTPHFIGPAHRPLSNQHLALAEQPLGSLVVSGVRLGEVQSGDMDAAVGRAAHAQLGPVDHQLLEAEVPQRLGRQRRDHARQAQRFAALLVHQHHVGKLERRDQAATFCGDAADANLHTEDARGLDFQVGTELSDSGHNPAMQRSPGEDHHQPCGGKQPQDPLRYLCGCLEQT